MSVNTRRQNPVKLLHQVFIKMYFFHALCNYIAEVISQVQ